MKLKMSILWLLFVGSFLTVTVHGHGKVKVVYGSNPGPCTKRNRGDIVFLKNRQGNVDLLLACSKGDGSHFQWSKLMSDEVATGEVFSPGYDCMSILDRFPNAKDGFYWITLNSKKARKVWCDMKTDGGGYFLIGKKNDSVTWTVPSNNDPVEPFGKPHWLSSFGEVDILDFRIQMASKEDFQATKAHWAYRLQHPRRLKNLMIINKGCTSNSPGIGDIKYVKDLVTDKIATTTFRCSKFGVGYHSNTKIGWTMMNSCLEKPCPWGFAFHRKYPFQLDYSGSFSYSVLNNISGIRHAATAFVGCSKGHCCGCHGPLNGKQDYCFAKCQPRNGGVVEPNTFTWFWVRTSLSKKLWTKCMDYKIKENDTYVWYKLVGDSEIPIQGRCDRKSKALMYSGMLVVPNNATAKKVLSVPGMIVYREDKKKLYVTKNEKLNALAEEKKIMGEIGTLKKTLTKFMGEMRKDLKNAVTQSNAKFAKLELELPSKIGDFGLPGKSCLDILQRSKRLPLSSGEYWIVLDSKPLKVYCDMKADGGGWTLISNLVLQQSRGMNWPLTSDYKKIDQYKKNKLALSTHGIRALGTSMSFSQLRFFCHKRIPGRTFDIATATNNLGKKVIQYFKAQTNSMPKSCGSYYRLPDDNSILARQCARWGYNSKYRVGLWHHGGLSSSTRLFDHAAFVGSQVHWLVRQSNGRWECDDYSSIKGYTVSAGDFWKIFVR